MAPLDTTGMASQREAVNPLRPYYIPPSIGEAPLPSAPTAAVSHGRPLPAGPSRGTVVGGYTNKARDMFADLDYKEYISEPSPSAMQSVRDVFNDLAWRYTSVLMAQPFEVARTILQVRSHELRFPAPNPVAELARQDSIPAYESAMHNPFADYDSDNDEPDYFDPPGPNASAYGTASRKQKAPSPSLPSPHTPVAPLGPVASSMHQLELIKTNSIAEVLSQLWQKEGTWGVWKGTNASFLYTVLQSLLETWSRSLLSALFNVPDLGLKDDVDRLIDVASPYPWASLFVAAAAAVATGLILAPLDLVRTRLIVTPTYRQPRRAISLLRSLPSLACSPILTIPTILHSLIHPLLTMSTPLVLRSRFAIDRDTSPVTFSIAKFCSSSVALFIKLPIETVLRRGQAAVLSTPEYVQTLESVALTNASVRELGMPTSMETIVPLGQYNGFFGTMYRIVSEEGRRVEVASATTGRESVGKAGKSYAKKSKTRIAETVYRRGQGMEGLWRGWKVSWWGLVGLWTAAAIGRSGDGQF